MKTSFLRHITSPRVIAGLKVAFFLVLGAGWLVCAIAGGFDALDDATRNDPNSPVTLILALIAAGMGGFSFAAAALARKQSVAA